MLNKSLPYINYSSFSSFQ